MATTVKRITLWRGDLPNEPGALAAALRPLSEAGVALTVAMAYKVPGDHTKAVVELYPIAGRKAQNAARAGGLSPSEIPTLLVEGDDRPGLGASLAQAVAARGINMSFLVTQVVGRKYVSVFGFDSDADAKAAAAILRKAGTGSRKKR